MPIVRFSITRHDGKVLITRSDAPAEQELSAQSLICGGHVIASLHLADSQIGGVSIANPTRIRDCQHFGMQLLKALPTQNWNLAEKANFILDLERALTA